jgi:hypothetical protein
MSNDQAFEIVKQLCERVPLAAADNEIMRQAISTLKEALAKKPEPVEAN